MRKRREGFFRRIAGGVVSARQRRAARARGVVRACTAAALALAIAPALAHECRILGNSYLRGSYEGDCEEKNEIAHGQGEAKGADTYAGGFVKGRPEGKGLYTWENGATLEGTFKAGKADGPGKYVSAKGTRYDGPFQNGRLAGATPEIARQRRDRSIVERAGRKVVSQ